MIAKQAATAHLFALIGLDGVRRQQRIGGFLPHLFRHGITGCVRAFRCEQSEGIARQVPERCTDSAAHLANDTLRKGGAMQAAQRIGSRARPSGRDGVIGDAALLQRVSDGL